MKYVLVDHAMEQAEASPRFEVMEYAHTMKSVRFIGSYASCRDSAKYLASCWGGSIRSCPPPKSRPEAKESARLAS